MNLVAHFDRARIAKRMTGKGYTRQFVEASRLFFGCGRLGFSEYYIYGLYDDRPFSEKQKFIGGRKNRDLFANGLNNTDWIAFARDKIAFYTLMKGAGIPFPKIHAIYHPRKERIFNGVPCLDEYDLSEFLEKAMTYPFFAKPVAGSHGDGAISVMGCERGGLVLKPGEKISITEFVRRLSKHGSGGYIFQETLMPHPIIREISGEALSTVRMVVFLSEKGPKLLRAVWRITAGNNVVDNYSHGSLGNMIAKIDVTSGKTLRVHSGAWPNYRTMEIHPDTGKSMLVCLPDWQTMVSLCFTAARLLSGLRLQHWDMAMSSSGPLPIEVNARGDFDLIQLAYDAGIEELLREP